MTKEEFKQWQAHMGYNKHQTAEALGVSHWTIKEYRAGRVKIKRTIEILCGMLRLQKWYEQEDLL